MAVFQPEILTNHHENHFHGFMAYVEEKNQNPFTYFSKYYQVAKYHSKLKFWSFHHSIDETQWFVAGSLKLSPGNITSGDDGKLASSASTQHVSKVVKVRFNVE